MSDRPDLVVLEKLLDTMLLDNENITARGVTRRQGSPFKHASDITRNTDRNRVLNRYKARQMELRAMMEKTDKQSKTNLARQISRLEEEKTTLEGQRDMLIASHRAMLLAVGETGGMAAWKRFFASWQETLEDLHRIKAMPSAEVHSLPAKNRS